MPRKLALVLLLFSLGCESESSQPKCYRGTVIGKIRSWGGGVAISVSEPGISVYDWHGYKNVVEALNVPDSLWKTGKIVFFTARQPNESEMTFPISADGDESAKSLIYILTISTQNCPPKLPP